MNRFVRCMMTAFVVLGATGVVMACVGNVPHDCPGTCTTSGRLVTAATYTTAGSTGASYIGPVVDTGCLYNDDFGTKPCYNKISTTPGCVFDNGSSGTVQEGGGTDEGGN